MIADCPYPPIYSSAKAVQSLPSEGYKIDWKAWLKMNSPTTSPVASFETKQVLSGKSATIDSIAAEFPKLVKQWKDETFFVSSSTKLFNHPAYVRIMAMGTAGISLVLKELQKDSGRWFYALKFMAGKDVSAGIKDYDEAKSAWLEWGYKNNYI